MTSIGLTPFKPWAEHHRFAGTAQLGTLPPMAAGTAYG